jgi:hypothetical protein
MPSHKVNFLIFVVLIVLSCSNNSEFIEYPPSKFLSDGVQRGIVNRFIFSVEAVDSISAMSQMEVLHKMYKLRYYVRKDSNGYFMISRSVHFLSTGMVCIGGKIGSDSIFDIHFRAQVPTYFSTDSVKIMYKKMLEY